MEKNKKEKIQEREKFIKLYKAALAAKLSREQLAFYLGVKPDSITRRRLNIYEWTSLDLPHLPLTGIYEIGDEQRKKFSAEIGKLTKDYNKESKVNKKNLTQYNKFVITSAQNATPIHEEFFAALLNYCKHNDAKLLVIPYRYKNPTSVFTDEGFDYWNEKLVPYLINDEIRLAKGLVVLGHIKIQPTAIQPLYGFDSYTGLNSGIFGHPKIQLRTIATPSNTLPKILTTTGSITMHNYTDSRAGHRAEFHHSFAASVVEVDTSGIFHMRHIHANREDGSFYDLDKYYTTNAVKVHDGISALVTGDSHALFIDPEVEKATYSDKNSMVNVLKPKKLILHDVLDSYSVSHHHNFKDLTRYGKHHFDRGNIENELQITADFIDRVSKEGMETYIVKSNHDEHFDRWLQDAEPKEDPENARFYHYMKYHQFSNIKMTNTGFSTVDPFEFWCFNPDKETGLSKQHLVKFLKRDESLVVNDIELSFHGDQGSNGSRGSLQAYSKIGVKSIIGHSHCLTEGHSVLEKSKGWINISDVKVGNFVLSYNNGTNEYVEVDELFKFNYSGTIIKFGGDILRQEVTDQHNLYLRDNIYLPIGQAIATKELGDIPLVANSLNIEDNLVIDKTIIQKIIAVCADAHIQDGKWIRFHVKKQRKIDRLKELFKDDLHPEGEPNSTGAVKISVKSGSHSYNELKEYIDFNNKELPLIFTKLTNELKEFVLSELHFWDGTFKADATIGNQFSTAKLSEANIISQIITELGYRNTCKLKYTKPSVNYAGTYVITWNSNRGYIISTNNSGCDKERIDKWKVLTEQVENIDVYCITNKNKNFWIRHDNTGKVSLTGNSPGIHEGAYQTGLSAYLNLEYKSGCDSWLHTHAIVYPDGKRTLVSIIKGRYRA